MKITASNESFQYLYSIVADANVSTIKKLRTAKRILSKAFGVVNMYETAKAPFVTELKKINEKIQLIRNAGKEDAKKHEIETLEQKKERLMELEVRPLIHEQTEIFLNKSEVKFILNEMKEVLALAKKLNQEEAAMFDRLFTALEQALKHNKFLGIF